MVVRLGWYRGESGESRWTSSKVKADEDVNQSAKMRKKMLIEGIVI